jgi:hypothetical protein
MTKATNELDRSGTTRDAFTTAELETIAAEAGLSIAAVRDALADARAGRHARGSTMIERWTGSSTPMFARSVPQDAASVRRAIDGYFEQQCFRIKCDEGDRIVYEFDNRLPRILSGAVMRSAFRGAREVVVELEADEAGGTRVRIAIDLGPARTATVIATGLGVYMLATGVFVAASLTWLPAFVGLVQLALGAVFLKKARQHPQDEQQRLGKPIERFLELVERGQPLLPDPSRAR